MTKLFYCASVPEVLARRDAIAQTVREEGYAVIRGIVDRCTVRAKLPTLYRAADCGDHRASSGVAPDEIRTNLRKWSIGGHSKSQASLARFMLTLYNPTFEEDIYGLRSEFNSLIMVRDALAARPPLTDDKLLPDRFNGCRVQIYPAGGGFMAAHVDSRAASNLPEDVGGVYIQLVLLLTERGTDYQTGGAFVLRDSAFVDSEGDSLSGDILVYDGSTMHGVADIDPSVGFNGLNLRGRSVAIATIYNRA
jgi:hypothetical protein